MKSCGLNCKGKGTWLKESENSKVKGSKTTRKHAQMGRNTRLGKCRATRHSHRRNPWSTQTSKNTQITPMKVVLHDIERCYTTFLAQSRGEKCRWDPRDQCRSTRHLKTFHTTFSADFYKYTFMRRFSSSDLVGQHSRSKLDFFSSFAVFFLSPRSRAKNQNFN